MNLFSVKKCYTVNSMNIEVALIDMQKYASIYKLNHYWKH